MDKKHYRLMHVALAALAVSGLLSAVCDAQIVPGGEHAPSVVQTRNGLPQADINRPSGAGVSMNTYSQFDVQKPGVILNNSPAIVQTQQAGMVNGNPNLAAGQSARVIVNQVNSAAASQIKGRVEVAGQRAEVVIANGSGISVNGGGFINTSRAILTTGTPNLAADGSLAGFNVKGGLITIEGSGLDVRDVDQVDLLSRAIKANAAIFLGKMTRRIEAPILTIQRETTMTTEITVGVAEDAFAKNNLVRLERSTYEQTAALSAADWIARRRPHDAALIEILHFVYSAICDRMSGYHLWLLLGDTRWQDDTRIIRHKKLFKSLKVPGIDFDALQDRREFIVEQSGKLKLFGAVRLEEDTLVSIPETMQPGSCTYLLALPGIAPALSESSGWSGRLCEDFQLIQSNVNNDGIIFQRVGYFDDLEVGLVALGKPDVVARLIGGNQ